MTFPDNIEEKLGFDKIRELTAEKCVSMAGLQELKKCSFNSNYQQLLKSLKYVSEFKYLLQFEGGIPTFNFFDLHTYFERIIPEGAYLEENEIWEIYLSLQTALDIIDFLESNRENCPSLIELIELVELDNFFLKDIGSYFDESGKISDAASAKLGRIRKQLKDSEKLLRKAIEKSFKAAVAKGYVDEGSSVSVRNGRVVIPIKSSERKKVTGLIHDQSSSGLILFIEPGEVVEINNQLKDWELQERKEVIKILTIVTAKLRSEVRSIKKANKFLGLIDYIRAKSALAIELNSILPELDNMPNIKLNKAYHPLLNLGNLNTSKKIIPLDFELNTTSQRIILISGPNAGGKSVALKTVGLLQYMTQSGFLIPVQEGTVVGIFKNIFIDIGDEQSIEDDLSTYSSHLNHMKVFMEHADKDSLILIDEFGSGTEPTIGGAIAEAVLGQFLHKKCMGVITTHFSNLKRFAEQENGIENAAMQFDTKKLVPLYKLQTGIPGGSFALEIASNIGISKKVLAEVKELVGNSYLDYDVMLSKLETEKENMVNKITMLETSVKEAELFKRNYKDLMSRLSEEKAEIITQAKKEAERIIKQSNKEVEKVIRDIKEAKANKGKTKRIRERLEEFASKVKTPKEKEPTESFTLGVGDSVEIIRNGVRGEVIGLKKDEVELLVGSLTSKIKIADIKKLKGSDQPIISKKKSSYLFDRKISAFNPVLDIRGEKVETAMPKIEKFLDDAILMGVSQLKILHGKGNGVLRSLVRDQLKTMDYVNSFEDEQLELGGSGITVIQFK